MTRCGSLVKPGLATLRATAIVAQSHILESSACGPPALHRSYNGPASGTTGGSAASSTRSTRVSFADTNGDGVGDLRRDHRPPRPPRPGRPRRRRDLAVADLPVARARPRLRRQRPRAGRPALRDGGGLRPAGRRGPSARDPGHPRPGHEPHQRRSTAGSSRRARRGPARTPTGTCGATRPASRTTARRCRRTTGCRSSAGRAGSGSRAASSSTTTRSWPSSPSSTGATPAVEAAQFAMVRGWLARGVDGFRLDVFNAFLKHPELRSNPVRPGTHRLGPPDPRLRPRPARPPGADRPVPGHRRRRARPDVGRRAVRWARSRRRPA